MGKVQEQAEEWGVARGEEWEGWVETAPAQVPVEIACVLVVEQRFLTRQAFPVMT
jgi:hypothetical protein